MSLGIPVDRARVLSHVQLAVAIRHPLDASLIDKDSAIFSDVDQELLGHPMSPSI